MVSKTLVPVPGIVLSSTPGAFAWLQPMLLQRHRPHNTSLFEPKMAEIFREASLKHRNWKIWDLLVSWDFMSKGILSPWCDTMNHTDKSMRLGNKAKHHVPISVVHCRARSICIWKMTFVARRCLLIKPFHINCCKRTHLFHGGPWTLEATPSRHLNVQHAEDSLELFLYLDTRRPWPMDLWWQKSTYLYIGGHQRFSAWDDSKLRNPTNHSISISFSRDGLHRRTWGFHGHWNVLWRGCLVIKSANLPRLRFPHERKDAK